jgi:integrase/recombinase XerD
VNHTKNNPQNDRAKRDYLIWLKEAKQRSPATVEQSRHAIDRLETYTGFKNFGTFNKEQALGFKRALLSTLAARSGKPISIATVHHTLQAMKDFLAWLHGRPGYRRRINPADIAYLSLTIGEERQAHATGPKVYASLEEYRTALFAMPANTPIERRNQALLALMLLTCMRDGAAASLKLHDFSIERCQVFQDPRHVNTKFRKTIETDFYPVGDDVTRIIVEWVKLLAVDLKFGPDDPVFPKAKVAADSRRNFAVLGLSREHWSNASPIRKIFKEAFARVGLPYVPPHSIRDTLTQLAYRLELTPEQFKVWSQNMGHDKPLTTLNSYGHVTSDRKAEIMTGLRRGQPRTEPDDATTTSIARKVVALLMKETT